MKTIRLTMIFACLFVGINTMAQGKVDINQLLEKDQTMDR